jgi:hypothetical protein
MYNAECGIAAMIGRPILPSAIWRLIFGLFFFIPHSEFHIPHSKGGFYG